MKVSALFVVVVLVGMALLSAFAGASQPTTFSRFEKAVGESAKEQLLAAYGGEAQVPMHDYLRLKAIFDRLTAVVNGNGSYVLAVLDSYEINAFSLPGGYVFITKGLLKLVGKDDQRIAGALAHEIAHIVNKHGMNALLRRLGLSVLVEVGKLVLEVPTTQEVHTATQALIEVVQSGYSREAELEADHHAQRYLVMAGFDPTGIIHMLSDLQELPKAQEVGAIFNSHPDPSIRIQQLLASVGDYWSSPQLISDVLAFEDSKQTDPLHRYLIVSKTQEDASPLQSYTLYDQQNQEFVRWLDDLVVNDLAFAPDGALIAGAVWDQGQGDVWIWNRQGSVIERWTLGHSGQISNLYFDPHSTRLVYQLGTKDGVDTWVGYLGEITRLNLNCRLDAEIVAWQKSGIILRDSTGDYYRIEAPKIESIRLPDPLPQVIERKPRLMPQVGQDANDPFRFRRPSNLEL